VTAGAQQRLFDRLPSRASFYRTWLGCWFLGQVVDACAGSGPRHASLSNSANCGRSFAGKPRELIGPSRYLCRDRNILLVESDVADVVIATNVMEHVRKPCVWIKELDLQTRRIRDYDQSRKLSVSRVSHRLLAGVSGRNETPASQLLPRERIAGALPSRLFGNSEIVDPARSNTSRPVSSHSTRHRG
jgi:hypothetical protein